MLHITCLLYDIISIVKAEFKKNLLEFSAESDIIWMLRYY